MSDMDDYIESVRLLRDAKAEQAKALREAEMVRAGKATGLKSTAEITSELDKVAERDHPTAKRLKGALSDRKNRIKMSEQKILDELISGRDELNPHGVSRDKHRNLLETLKQSAKVGDERAIRVLKRIGKAIPFAGGLIAGGAYFSGDLSAAEKQDMIMDEVPIVGDLMGKIGGDPESERIENPEPRIKSIADLRKISRDKYGQ